MPASEDQNSGQLSQPIDVEIERKVSERLREIEEQLDQRVQETIHDDREFIKDTIGVAFKVAGFAVALVVIVLGALGWKTFSDVDKTIKETAKATAKEKAEGYFLKPDGNHIMDDVVNRAVLDSYLVQIKLLDAQEAADKASGVKRVPLRFAIQKYDVSRLLDII